MEAGAAEVGGVVGVVGAEAIAEIAATAVIAGKNKVQV
jgi:hypothetical protein